MTPIKILKLIWILLEILLKRGNVPVYYHICDSSASYDCPMEVEGVEIRETLTESKVTIY